jgi:hypothetical protein
MPTVAGWSIHRAASTRRKCPWDTTSARSVASVTTRRITQSARARTSSADSPPGLGWVHTLHPGSVRRISSVVRPSYSP